MNEGMAQESGPCKLVGYINPIGPLVGFLLPIFRGPSSDLFVQDISEGDLISRFVPFELRKNEDLIPVPSEQQTIQTSVNKPAVYAFLLPGQSIFAGEQQRLQMLLRARAHDSALGKYPFVKLEVFKFIGSLDRAQEIVSKARNILAIDNSRLADEWAASQLKALSANIATVASPTLTKMIYQSGFLSFPELKEELRSCATENLDFYVRLKLVRSCAGTTDKTKELVRSFGLRPEKLDSESRMLRLKSSAIKSIFALGRLVAIISAEATGARNFKVEALSVRKLKMRYFKKSEKNIKKQRWSTDYFYSKP